MASPSSPPDPAAVTYLRDTFRAGDRLAVVVLNRRTQAVTQRLGSLERLTSPDFQAWLRLENEQRRCEIYVSMNALHPEAKGRTKHDVAAIRHVYLDFDENGTKALDALLNREDVPRPSYVINSSPDKWQVTWRVEGFGKTEAETLQKGLARDAGADLAATDCARVLRVPGFYNQKYGKPFLVRSEQLSTEVYAPDRFPKPSSEDRTGRSDMDQPSGRRYRPGPRMLSQSERDWAFAKRALARGESPALVVATIASYRRFDKPNPQYYAELTVKKAQEALQRSESQSRGAEREL
jgi:RepB DNA-primase N-terminal domain